MKCPYCHRPLIEIDYYGEVLVGCVECNRWGKPGDKNLVMELLEDDLEALRASKLQPFQAQPDPSIFSEYTESA
jgi:hypothetical protein